MHIDELTSIAKHLTRSAVCGVTKEQLLRTFKEIYSLSDNEIKTNIITAINQYFDIENWDFASAAEELRKDWNIPHTGEGKHPRVLQAMRVLNMWATRLALTSENTADVERARNEQR